ncbi:ABC transporter ATP-binding protein [Pseudomonas sp. RIT-PI-AD]|uniref:ABC transporter ATP-binding protein n=1 Tax=Pseudomonas sp. RIT-PI-AD TaxID=3035294 RepID=UPI0021DB1FFC|nr:ABC transporter ATP-binding protein [Pseudomonas sp. RIT-PI-AD]
MIDSGIVALSLSGISKGYGEIGVLHGIDMDLHQGEIVALLGPSGCGKTTTLRAIGGFVVPDSGRIRIKDVDVTRLAVPERDFGIVFQDYALFPHLTVAQNIHYGLKHRRYRARPHADRVAELLALVRMQAFADRYPAQLSGGQKQRVALARALGPSPAVLLLDEPLSALDASVRGKLQVELREVLREVGITTVIVTHDHEEAAVVADRIVLMHEGRIVQDGTPLAIYDRPRSRFCAEFLGEVNWLGGRVARGLDAQRFEALLDNGQRVVLGAGQGPLPPADTRLEIGIRPERLALADAASGPGTRNRLTGTLARTQAHRTNVELCVALDGGQSLRVVHRRDDSVPAVGSPVALDFGIDDAFYWPAEGA